MQFGPDTYVRGQIGAPDAVSSPARAGLVAFRRLSRSPALAPGTR